ncbi:hypothetical protein QQP08_009176 [Theobroma cacao]|nr:hypothetical protein QQP08_009176 [Theobroma cacao]
MNSERNRTRQEENKAKGIAILLFNYKPKGSNEKCTIIVLRSKGGYGSLFRLLGYSLYSVVI